MQVWVEFSSCFYLGYLMNPCLYYTTRAWKLSGKTKQNKWSNKMSIVCFFEICEFFFKNWGKKSWNSHPSSLWTIQFNLMCQSWNPWGFKSLRKPQSSYNLIPFSYMDIVQIQRRESQTSFQQTLWIRILADGEN